MARRRKGKRNADASCGSKHQRASYVRLNKATHIAICFLDERCRVRRALSHRKWRLWLLSDLISAYCHWLSGAYYASASEHSSDRMVGDSSAGLFGVALVVVPGVLASGDASRRSVVKSSPRRVERCILALLRATLNAAGGAGRNQNIVAGGVIR